MRTTVHKIPKVAGMSVIVLALCLLFLCMFASQAQAQEQSTLPLSATTSEAVKDDAAFAISDLRRLNKGMNKDYNGQNYGYSYAMRGQNAFAVIVISENQALVYVPKQQGEAQNFDINSDEDKAAFEEMLTAIDDLQFGGSTKISSLSLNFEYTTETSVSKDGYNFDFAVEIDPGFYWTCVNAASAQPAKEQLADGQSTNEQSANVQPDGEQSAGNPQTLFAFSGYIVPADQVVIAPKPEGFAALIAFVSSIDFRPFWVSLRTSAVAMIFVFILGILAAWFSQRMGNRLKGVLDSVLTIPLVLPPTVCGFLLLVLFGNSTGFGRWLLEHDIQLIFSWPAAVIAAVVVSFPLLYRTARGAFESLDPALSDAARTLGWSEWRLFRKLVIPLSWPSIAAGTVLAFARAMGEFGATLFVAGNYPGITQTMPIAIYFEWMGGHSDVATFWVFVVILFSFVVILFVNWYASRTQRYRKISADEGGLFAGLRQREAQEQAAKTSVKKVKPPKPPSPPKPSRKQKKP